MVRVTELAHQMTKLVGMYKTMKVDDLIDSINGYTRLEVDVALWETVDEGWLEVDEAKEHISFISAPESYSLGTEYNRLNWLLLYLFNRSSQEGSDWEETSLNFYLSNYSPHTRAMVIKDLMESGVLASYRAKDSETLLDDSELGEAGSTVDVEYHFIGLAKTIGERFELSKFKDGKNLTLIEEGEEETSA